MMEIDQRGIVVRLVPEEIPHSCSGCVYRGMPKSCDNYVPVAHLDCKGPTVCTATRKIYEEVKHD